MKQPHTTQNCFSHIIVGTSPLMLMHAMALAALGGDVCVLDHGKNYGGAWQTKSIEGESEVEIGCHLIEYFPNVYELLENASGVRFVVPEVPPVRIMGNDRPLPYHSRLMLIAGLSRMSVNLLRLSLEKILGRQPDENQILNYQLKLGHMLRYQLACFFDPGEILFPEGGFYRFQRSLEAKCMGSNVTFRNGFEVRSLKRESDGTWELTSRNGLNLQAKHVICTSSANLIKTSNTGYVATNVKTAVRQSLVVRHRREKTRKKYAYVALWRDQLISRVSEIENSNNDPDYDYFLIELRSSAKSLYPEELSTKVNEILVRIGVLKHDQTTEKVGFVDCNLTQNTSQLQGGIHKSGLEVLVSSGNLAAGIAHWKNEYPNLADALTEI